MLREFGLVFNLILYLCNQKNKKIYLNKRDRKVLLFHSNYQTKNPFENIHTTNRPFYNLNFIILCLYHCHISFNSYFRILLEAKIKTFSSFLNSTYEQKNMQKKN